MDSRAAERHPAGESDCEEPLMTWLIRARRIRSPLPRICPLRQPPASAFGQRRRPSYRKLFVAERLFIGTAKRDQHTGNSAGGTQQSPNVDREVKPVEPAGRTVVKDPDDVPLTGNRHFCLTAGGDLSTTLMTRSRPASRRCRRAAPPPRWPPQPSTSTLPRR